MFIKRFALIAVLIPLLSCGPDEVDPNIAVVKAKSDECKARLAGGNYTEARNAGEEVLKVPVLMSIKDPATGEQHPLVNQIRFCYTTASTLHTLNELTKNVQNTINMILTLLGDGSLAGSESQPFNVKAAAARFETMNTSLIFTALDSFIGPVRKTLEDNQKIMEEIKKRKDFKFEILRIPVKIADSELLDAGGTYDLGEIHILYGLTRAILGVFYTLESINYNFGTGDILEYVMGVDNSPLEELSARPFAAVLNLIAVLMSTNQSFLALESGSGKELMGKAGDGYGAGFAGILDAIQHMKGRKGDQSKNLIEFRKDDAGREDLLVFHFDFQNNPIPIIDLDKFSDLEVPIRADIIEGLENLRNNFDGAPGVRANLHRDIFPMVALATVVLLKSGAFDSLIATALADMDAETKAQVDSALGILTGNRDLITGLLASLIPVTVELDFGYIFRNPIGLREVFPAWSHPAKYSAPTDATEAEKLISPMQPFTTATIMLSYECRDGKNPLHGTSESVFCSDAEDGGHFEDVKSDGVYPWKNNNNSQNFGPTFEGRIEQDGIAVITPYIPFKNASFGGLLYLDITQIAEEPYLTAPDPSLPMPKADLRILNASIAAIVANIQGFIP